MIWEEYVASMREFGKLEGTRTLEDLGSDGRIILT
jgi:hypothetical protein